MSAVLRRNWLVVAWFILAMMLTIIIHVTASAAERKNATEKNVVPNAVAEDCRHPQIFASAAC
jgi:hypothetical protein